MTRPKSFSSGNLSTCALMLVTYVCKQVNSSLHRLTIGPQPSSKHTQQPVVREPSVVHASSYATFGRFAHDIITDQDPTQGTLSTVVTVIRCCICLQYLVVFAVMDLHGLRIDAWLQAVVLIRQLGYTERHAERRCISTQAAT